MIAFKCEYVGVLHEYMLKSSVEKDSLGKATSSFPSSLNIKTLRNELLVIDLKNIQSPIAVNLSPQCNKTNFAGLVEYGTDVIRLRDMVSISESGIAYCNEHYL